MNKYLLLLTFVLPALLSFGQSGLGFDLGFGTSKSGMLAGKYYYDEHNAFSVGFSYQSNHELGKRNSKQAGDTIIGNGHYFYSVDLGYTRIFDDQFSLEGEISTGPKKYYTNFRDNNLSAGGFHVIDKSKFQVGLGALFIYHFNEIFGLYGGYNTIRQATFGLQVRFRQKE